MRNFLSKYAANGQKSSVPLETRLARFRQMRERLGELEFIKLIGSFESAITMHLQASRGGLVKCTFEMIPASPPVLAGIRVGDLEQGRESGPPTAPKPNEAEWVRVAQDYISEAFHETGPQLGRYNPLRLEFRKHALRTMGSARES